MTAYTVSSSVAVPYVVSTSSTGRLSDNVVPKSPRNTLPRYSTYCTRMGRSYPAAWTRSASWAAVSLPPSAAVIGSPVARMSQNTVVTRMKTVGMISRKRTRT